MNEYDDDIAHIDKFASNVFLRKITGDENLINWSLFLINKKFISKYKTISKIGFLIANAPHHLLKLGVKFTLFEGAKEVANGEII